ncbi:MAG: DUF6502 family protein [Oceanococcus sp.]
MNGANLQSENDESRLSAAVKRMLTSVLRALARIVLRQNVGYPTFERIAKQAFIDVTRNEYGLRGRAANKSRIALVTGINRRDVARCLVADANLPQDPLFNPVFRVVSRWIREPAYRDEFHQPLVLDIAGKAPSVEALQEFDCPDTPLTAVVSALISGGLANYSDEGKARLMLTDHGFIPQQDIAAKYELLGIDVSALLQTIEHNMYASAPAMYQRKVSFPNLSASGLECLQKMASEQGQSLLESMDAELSEHRSEDGCFAGMGLYVFIEPDRKDVANVALSKEKKNEKDE